MTRKLQSAGKLVLLVVWALLWVSPAVAEDEKALYIAGTKVTLENCNNLSSISGVTVAEGGEFRFDFSSRTLTMKGVTIKNEKELISHNIDNLCINVSGKNQLEATHYIHGIALHFHRSTIMSGDGELNVIASNIGFLLEGHETSLTLSDLTLDVSAGSYGLRGKHIVIIKNASVRVNSRESSAVYLYKLLLEGSSIVFPVGGWFDDSGSHTIEDSHFKPARVVRIEPEFYPLWIAGTQVRGNFDLAKIAGVRLAQDGHLKYDKKEKTLTMKGVTIDAGEENAIYNEGIDGLTIKVEGTNQLNSKKVATLLLKSHTLMTGNGDFTAISDGGAGVYIDQTTSLTLSNLGFSTSGQWGFVGKDGVSDEKLIVKDAWVKAKGIEGAIGKIASLSAEGGYIAIPENGLFDESKHAVVDAMGNITTDATILGTTYPLRIADIPVTKSNCNDLSSIAGVTVETGGVFKFDPNTKILTMRGVTININEREKHAIYNGIHGLTIDVVGKNQLTADVNSFGLCTGASTVIKGEGLLRIVDCNSIYHQETLTIEDLTLDASEGKGIYGNGDVFIKNATVTTRGFVSSSHWNNYRWCGALSGRRITLEDCKIVTPEGGYFSRKQNTILPRPYDEYYTVKIEPAPSFRTYPLWIGERQVTTDICNDLSVMTGARIGEGGGISYNPDSKTLTINRVDLAPNDSEYDNWYHLDNYLVENEGVEDLTIDVFGWGYLGKLRSLASTHIKGRGRLRVYGVTEIGRSVTLTLSNAEFDMHWIKGVDGSSDERLVVKGANVYVNGQYTSYIRDIASLTLDGCDFQDANLKFDERVHAVVTQGGDIAERVRIVQTNYPLWIAGRQVTRYNCNYLKNFPGVTVAKDGQFRCRVDYSGSVQLDMSGVTIQAGDGQSAISGDLEKITLRGDNRLTSTDKPALQLSETLCIESSSTARLSISSTGNDAIHLLADRALKLEGIELELTGKQGIAWEKESLGNSLRLRKALLKAKGTEGAIRNLRKLEEAHILNPAGGKLEDEKHTIVDAEGNVAKEVVITGKKLPLKIAGQQVTVENYNNLSGLSGVSVKEGGVFKYDPVSQTLTMKDVSIWSRKEAAVYSIGREVLTIEVAGTNYLSSDEDNALRSEGNIHIKRDGKLTVSSEKWYSIKADGFLTLSDLTLDVKGGYSSEYGRLGISVGSMVIKNATVTVSGSTDTGSLTLEGCQILSPEGARFNKEKRKVVDANGNSVTNLKIGKKEPVTGITVTPSNQTLKEGETLILSATVVPDNATVKGVTWSSSDATIASVSKTGEVTALKKGKCTITAQTKEEGSKVKGICEIVVTSQEAPAKFSITLTKEGEGTLAIVGYDDEALKAVAVDTELTVTATPAEGYSLTSLIAGTADILTTKKFTVTEAVEVKAVFKKKQNNGGGNQGGGNNGGGNGGGGNNGGNNGGNQGGNNGGGNNGGGSWKPQTPQAVEDVTLASIVVAPNPFTSQLRIENPASLEVRYELVNVGGVVVRSGVLKGTEGVIATEDLPQGVYIARFYGANSAKRSLRVMKH